MFHLSQSIYWKDLIEVRAKAFVDQAKIREASHVLCILAFVPVDEVGGHFDTLIIEVPEEFCDFAEYFEVYYTRRGKRIRILEQLEASSFVRVLFPHPVCKKRKLEEEEEQCHPDIIRKFGTITNLFSTGFQSYQLGSYTVFNGILFVRTSVFVLQFF